jgi:hypothetical protein
MPAATWRAPAGSGDAFLHGGGLSGDSARSRGVKEFGACGLRSGDDHSTGRKEREDDYGEEGKEESEQEEGRTGAQEEENDEGVGEESGAEGDEEEGGSKAEGRTEEGSPSADARAGTCSLLAASDGVGNGHRRLELTALRAF